MPKQPGISLEQGKAPKHQRINRQAFRLAWQTIRWVQQFPEHLHDEMLMLEECGLHMRTAVIAASSCLLSRQFSEVHRG